MAKRMATECVASEEHYVRSEHERSNADAKMRPAGSRVDEPECSPHVVKKKDQEDECEIEEVTMDILQHQREGALATVGFSRLADSAGRRIGPEGFVIRAAIVV